MHAPDYPKKLNKNAPSSCDSTPLQNNKEANPEIKLTGLTMRQTQPPHAPKAVNLPRSVPEPLFAHYNGCVAD